MHDAVTDESIYDIEVDASGRILTFIIAGDNSEVVSIDPETGATTHVATLPQINGEFPGEKAIDQQAGILYMMTELGTDFRDLVSVDLASGQSTIVPLQIELRSFVACSMCREK